MNLLDLYGGTSLSLALDFYQLTSAYALWKQEKHEAQAVYHMFHRTLPFNGGYAVAAGLEYVLDWIERFELDGDDLMFIGQQQGNDGKPLFPGEFIEYLADFRFDCTIHAAGEGTVVFPYEPMLRVKGPLIDHLFLETYLLTAINSQTLFATKAARVCEAAVSAPVLEFGMRRAQGLDGAVGASRACYIGGCSATSNVLAGRLLGIPVKGTHPHGFVMAFDTEAEAFAAYADALPANCVWLVDTYDTIQGVKNAIDAAKALKARGHIPIGIRLDSGDLAYLSIEARRLLDEAELPEMKIFASNDLDEHLIQSLRDQGAQIGLWGVGTKLITAYDQPALGGVYKMGALETRPGTWEHKIKVSEQAAKTTIPGCLNVRRYGYEGGYFAADMIYDELTVPKDYWEGTSVMVDPLDPTRQRRFTHDQRCDTLLKLVMKHGRKAIDHPPLNHLRARAMVQLDALHPTIRRLVNPHVYPVGIESSLYKRRTAMVLQARGLENGDK